MKNGKIFTTKFIMGVFCFFLMGPSLAQNALSAQFTGQGKLLALPDVIRLAESYNPDLRAAKAQEVQAQKEVTIQQSFYYPTLNLDGMAAAGLPGSNQHGLIGTGGLIDSPFAESPVGGLVSQLNVLDLTIPFKVKSARYYLEATQQHTEVIRYEVDWKALGYYFDAMRYLSASIIWKDVYKRVNALAQVVEKLVRTGQHNLADQYLIQVQAGLAKAEMDASLKRYQASLENLALFVGKKSDQIAVPSFTSFDDKSIKSIAPGTASAFILKAVADAESAHSLVNASKAENYPKIVGLGSAGGMRGVRAGASLNDYSAGVGLNLPLFEGFRIESQVQKARGFETERLEQINGLKLFVDEDNARYDQEIAYDSAKIGELTPLLKVSQQAFSESRQRYLDYTGPLVDLRDAIQYLSQVQGEINRRKTSLWFNIASKAVLNGGKVSP